MNYEDKAQELIKKWKKAIINEEKGRENLPFIFSMIFSDFITYEIPEEVAESFIDKISSHLYPPPFVSKTVYLKTKATNYYFKNITFNEFINSWKLSIKETAMKEFLEAYPPQEDKKIKKIGGMNHVEYKLQRSHAESYPLIDPSSISQSEYNEDIYKDLINKIEEEAKDKEKEGGK
jgi:hypothetical protein